MDKVKEFIKKYYEFDEGEFEPQTPFVHLSISDLAELLDAYAGAIWQEQQVNLEELRRGLWQLSLGVHNMDEPTEFSKYVVEKAKHLLTLLPGSTPVESKEAQEHDKTLNKLYDVQERLARKEDEIGDLVLELQELRARPSKEGKYRELLALAEAELCAMYNRLGFKSSNILNQITDALNS